MLILFIVVMIAFVYLVSKKTTRPGCNMRCDECPFPPCSEKEKAWMRKHYK